MTVKVFRSTDFGAPTNTNAAGSTIALLDAVLVNGYGLQTATSITRTGTTATVTLPSAHLLKDGTFVRIAGATQTDYNGDFPITVTGANTFTYQVANSPATPATGTITSKVAPAGWTKPFSGTNLAAYKTGVGSNGMYFRIDDTVATSGSTSSITWCGYETMTDINTGTGRFPTTAQATSTGECGFLKAFGGTQAWTIVATEKIAYFAMQSGALGNLNVFGDFDSFKSGDIFNTVIIGQQKSGYVDQPSILFGTVLSSNLASISFHYTARDITQIGSSIASGKTSAHGTTRIGGVSGAVYPNPASGSLHINPIYITESNCTRGTLKGVWHMSHNRPFSDGDVIFGSGDYVGKKFLVVDFGSSVYGNVGQVLFEISNTW